MLYNTASVQLGSLEELRLVELVRNVMARAQKPDLVFQRNGRVHLNRWGFQFSRLLAADACASAVVTLDRPSSDTVQDCWLPTPFAYFPFTSPPVRHRVPSDSERAIPTCYQLPVEYTPRANLQSVTCNRLYGIHRPLKNRENCQYHSLLSWSLRLK